MGLALLCRLHCLAAAMEAIVCDAILLADELLRVMERQALPRAGEEPPCMAGDSHGDTITWQWLSPLKPGETLLYFTSPATLLAALSTRR